MISTAPLPRSERSPASSKLARTLGASCLALAALGSSPRAGAQELEARAYSATPIETSFFFLAYSHTTGSVVTDPSLPVQNIEADIDSAAAAAGRTFPLFGKVANVGVAVPYIYGDVAGDVLEQRREITRSGLGDVRLRLAWHLLGNPAMKPAEFAKRAPTTVVGVSLTVVAPTGQYDPAKLINLGGNRWAFKPEIGWAHPIGRWTLELFGGVWLFTDNDEFFGGTVRRQDPIYSLQTHVAYSFKPRLWLAVDATAYRGGRTRIDGVGKRDFQDNSRLGLTLSVPFRGGRAVKLAWTEGLSTRIGGDFQTFTIGVLQTRFDRNH